MMTTSLNRDESRRNTQVIPAPARGCHDEKQTFKAQARPTHTAGSPGNTGRDADFNRRCRRFVPPQAEFHRPGGWRYHPDRRRAWPRRHPPVIHVTVRALREQPVEFPGDGLNHNPARRLFLPAAALVKLAAAATLTHPASAGCFICDAGAVPTACRCDQRSSCRCPERRVAVFARVGVENCEAAIRSARSCPECWFVVVIPLQSGRRTSVW
jgi:hypothetical protein